jgi:hypothetical protein
LKILHFFDVFCLQRYDSEQDAPGSYFLFCFTTSDRNLIEVHLENTLPKNYYKIFTFKQVWVIIDVECL